MLLALPRSCQFCYFTWVVCVGFLESRARASVIGLCFTWRDSVNYRGVGHSWFVCLSYLIGELSSSTLPVLRLGQIFKSEIEIEGQIRTWKEYSEVGPEGKKVGWRKSWSVRREQSRTPVTWPLSSYREPFRWKTICWAFTELWKGKSQNKTSALCVKSAVLPRRSCSNFHWNLI